MPKTVVCNNKHEIQALANQCKDLIIKPLNTAFVPGDRHGLDSISIMTNTLSRAELNGSDETEWRQSPCIVQERIHKAFEIRLIQVGDESFAMRVPSAELEHASVDWRRAQTELTYTPLPVSDALRATAAEYLRMSKLRFGVFDLAVDAEGEVFFFECNSSGQWAWMEKEADDFAISRFVANAFYRQVGLQ